MRIKKIISAILIVLIMVLPLTGCDYKTYKFFLDQEIVSVEKVEIWQYDRNIFKSNCVATLDKDTADILLKDISNLNIQRHFPGDHTTNFCDAFLYVTYKNGEAEAFCPDYMLRFTADGDSSPKDYYFVDALEWYSIVFKHTKNILPDDLKDYFENTIADLQD